MLYEEYELFLISLYQYQYRGLTMHCGAYENTIDQTIT